MKIRCWAEIGHGIRPDGTYDPGAGGEWDEQTAGDVIVRAYVDWLHERGFNVWRWVNGRPTITRRGSNPDWHVFDTSYSPDLNYVGSPAQAAAWGATVLVAVHHDWVRGIAAMFGFWNHDDGKRLADRIRDRAIAAGFPHNTDWHKYRALGLLTRCRDLGITHATLIEVGRIGQDDIDTDAERVVMGEALAAGTLDHLNIDPTLTDTERLTMAEIDTILDRLDGLPRKVLDEKITDDVTGEDVTLARLLRAARDDSDRARHNSLLAAQATQKTLIMVKRLAAGDTPTDAEIATAQGVVDEIVRRLSEEGRT